MLGEEGVIEYEIQFRSAGGNAGPGFAQLGIGILSALVKTDDRCYHDCGALQVCDAALDPVQADADRLAEISLVRRVLRPHHQFDLP